MTEFFKYDDMTWDTVADLARDIPLVLPLGSGYDLGLLAAVVALARAWRLAAAASDRGAAAVTFVPA